MMILCPGKWKRMFKEKRYATNLYKNGGRIFKLKTFHGFSPESLKLKGESVRKGIREKTAPNRKDDSWKGKISTGNSNK